MERGPYSSKKSLEAPKQRPKDRHMALIGPSFRVTKAILFHTNYMSYSLNSLKRVYIGDYIGDYYNGY